MVWVYQRSYFSKPHRRVWLLGLLKGFQNTVVLKINAKFVLYQYSVLLTCGTCKHVESYNKYNAQALLYNVDFSKNCLGWWMWHFSLNTTKTSMQVHCPNQNTMYRCLYQQMHCVFSSTYSFSTLDRKLLLCRISNRLRWVMHAFFFAGYVGILKKKSGAQFISRPHETAKSCYLVSF